MSRTQYFDLDREFYQDTFIDFLTGLGFSNYGLYEGKEDYVLKRIDDNQVYRNNVFELSHFWWGDCTCGGEPDTEFMTPEKHTEECMIYRHNFIYKPTGFWLDWYKYPLRGNHCNKKITSEEFLKILNHCRESFYD